MCELRLKLENMERETLFKSFKSAIIIGDLWYSIYEGKSRNTLIGKKSNFSQSNLVFELFSLKV